ncbi:MAG TPA: DUF167 domain-containing protein [Methylomirabilota bacterium]|nr:DUF167 domain-containing protein [Methylomirabilota bacterium]
MPSRIWVKVKPQAKEESVKLLPDGDYQVSCHAPPRDGKANQALIELLARYFSVPKSTIKILRGNSARKKLIQIG